ncbi:guanine nucleotide-binding protein G(I)/G(S)/G(O) subunit gamma-4 isoform 2-T3 [Anomaloglossus baeobatrachus]
MPIMEVVPNTEDNLEDSEEAQSAVLTATSASEMELTSYQPSPIPNTSQPDAEEMSSDLGLGTCQSTNVIAGQSTGQQSGPSPVLAESSPQQHAGTQPRISTNTMRTVAQSIRGRRHRRYEDLRSLPDIIDTRILHMMNSLIPESDGERFCRSLSPSLALVAPDRQGRLRASLITLISATQREPEPIYCFEVIEQWRANPRGPHTNATQQTVETQIDEHFSNFQLNPVVQQTHIQCPSSSMVTDVQIRPTVVPHQTGTLMTQRPSQHPTFVPQIPQQTPMQTSFNYPSIGSNVHRLPQMIQQPTAYHVPNNPQQQYFQQQTYPTNFTYTHTQPLQTHHYVPPTLGLPSAQKTASLFVPSTTTVTSGNTDQTLTTTFTVVQQTYSVDVNAMETTQESITSLEDLVES